MASLDGYGIAVLAFLALSLTVGTLTSRLVKKSSKRYMIAGKSLPLFFVGTMLAAQSIDGKRLNKMAMLTLPDFYYRRFGNASEGISGILMMISFIVLVAGNFAASGFILSTVLGIDFIWAMLIAAIIVLIYTYAGGLFSSAYTDIFQIYLAIGAFWAAFIFFAGGFSGVQFGTILGNAPPEYLDLSGLFDMGNGALVNWAGILALGLGDIVALDFMERVFSAKDPKTAQRGALMGAGLTLSTVIPTSMMGIVALYFLPNIADPFTAYPQLAINHVPFPIGAALLMGVLGASMSTANGGLLAISSVMSRNIIQSDILRKWFKRSGMDDKKLLRTTRIFTIPMMAAAFILGSALRLLMFFITPANYAGIETMIPPVISFVLFIGVALTTQKKYPGRHGVVDYVPPEEDVVRGEDLKDYVDSGGTKYR